MFLGVTELLQRRLVLTYMPSGHYKESHQRANILQSRSELLAVLNFKAMIQ